MIRAILFCLLLGCGAAVRAETVPTTQPLKQFTSIADALKQVPAGVIPADPQDWNDAKIDAADIALGNAVNGQRIALRARFESVQRTSLPDGNIAYSLIGTAEEETAGTKINLTVLFDQAGVLDLARLNKGDLVTADGEARIYFEANGGATETELVVQVTAAKVVKVTRDHPTPTTGPSVPQTPPTGESIDKAKRSDSRGKENPHDSFLLDRKFATR